MIDFFQDIEFAFCGGGDSFGGGVVCCVEVDYFYCEEFGGGVVRAVGIFEGSGKDDIGESSATEGFCFYVLSWRVDPFIVLCSPVFQILPINAIRVGRKGSIRIIQ